MEVRVPHLRLPFDLNLAMPGSKSHANRAIIAACLAEGRTLLRRATPCDDVRLLVDNLKAMGFRLDWRDERDGLLEIEGGLPQSPPSAEPIELDCELAGTTLRFLTALCCLVPGDWIITGNERMRQRPVGALVDALRELGADAVALGGTPPVRVRGGLRRGGAVELDASQSSQFVTALMLIAPRLEGGLQLHWGGELASAPYVDLTEKVLEDFGVKSERSDDAVKVPQAGLRAPEEILIEGDWSAAGAWLALSLLTRSRFTAPNLDLESVQADRALPVFLAMLGDPGTVQLDVVDVPDQAMNLAVYAAMRRGRTVITGADNIRLKESDRITATIAGLRAMGAVVEETDVGMIIDGPTRLKAARIETHGDHRLAMAFAVLGSLVEGVDLDDGSCVSKSYPDFFDDLREAHAPTATRCVALVGMRGAGKTSLAKVLAEVLKLQVSDSDELFESAHGPISDFVADKGWDAFREIESGVIADCLAPGRVVAIGGGALESTANMEVLRQRALVVWVREEVDTLVERLRDGTRPPLTDRPLAEEVEEVLGRRQPSYKAGADLVLPPGGTIAERAAAIETWLREPFTQHAAGA